MEKELSIAVDITSQTNALKNLQSSQQSLQTHFSNTKTTATNQRAQLSESISNMSVDEIANSVDGTTSEAKNIAKAAQDVRLYLKSKQYASGTSAHAGTGTGGGMLPVSAGASAQASNAQSFGDSKNTVSEERYNESAAIIDNYAHRLAQSKRDDATTRNAKDLDHSLQEMHSLQDAMNINQAKIDQVESAIQHMQSSTVTVSSNANEEYARIAQKQNPNLTLNQAKEQFFTASKNNPGHQRVLRQMQSENASKYNAKASKFKSPDVSDTNFTKDELMQSYANKQAETEAKMANTGNEIAQEQRRIRNEKEKSSKKFDDDKNKASMHIHEGESAVTNTKEQIKNAVDKRANRGAIMEAKDVVWDATTDTLNNVKKFFGVVSDEKLPETQDNENNHLTSANSNSKERIKNGK